MRTQPLFAALALLALAGCASTGGANAPTGVDLAKRVNADLHGWEDSLGLSGAERSDLAGAIGRLTEAIDGAPDRMASPVS